MRIICFQLSYNCLSKCFVYINETFKDDVPMKDSYPPCATFHTNVAFFFQKAGFLFLIFEFVYTKCYKSPLLLYDLQINTYTSYEENCLHKNN